MKRFFDVHPSWYVAWVVIGAELAILWWLA